jgi:endonuclease/exonuclease/phosphatase family metal-dependent hydrolase
MHCLLQSKRQPRLSFVFAQTHLKAKEKFVETRLKQTQQICRFFSSHFEDLPVFVGGDFNEEPQNPPIKEMLREFVDLYSLSKQEQFPPFTTFKFRPAEGYKKRTIDYLFLRNKTPAKVSVLRLVDPADLEREQLLDLEMANPCANHPSDHYSLAYEVLIE